VWRWQRDWASIPLPRCASCIFFGLGIGQCSHDLCYWRSGAGVGTGAVGAGSGEVGFEIEETAVGFAVGRDLIGFVDGEDVRNVFGGHAYVCGDCRPCRTSDRYGVVCGLVAIFTTSASRCGTVVRFRPPKRRLTRIVQPEIASDDSIVDWGRSARVVLSPIVSRDFWSAPGSLGPSSRARIHFTSTVTRIHGWMQH
jgi:hypothetical protein